MEAKTSVLYRTLIDKVELYAEIQKIIRASYSRNHMITAGAKKRISAMIINASTNLVSDLIRLQEVFNSEFYEDHPVQGSGSVLQYFSPVNLVDEYEEDLDYFEFINLREYASLSISN